jgi:cardiolipin synthase
MTEATTGACRGGDGRLPATSEQATSELDRVLTVPNIVTTARLACVPVFVWLLFGAHEQTSAAVLLAVLGTTDFVDGFLARRYHQVSTLGKILDPSADRVLVATAVIAVMVHGAVPLWFGLATIAREALVTAAVGILAVAGAERIDVLWVGKAGTFALMVSYPAFLISDGTAGWQLPFHVLAWVSGLAGLALAWVALGAYIRPAHLALDRGRESRYRAAAASRSADRSRVEENLAAGDRPGDGPK